MTYLTKYPGVFEEAFEELMQWEGEKYSVHPNDPGGGTKFGISSKAYPNLDIKNLKKEEAKSIYEKDYWMLQKCDDIFNASDSKKIVKKLFITSVNIGNVTAAKILQSAINDATPPPYNVDLKSYLKIDGKIGPLTLGTLNNITVFSLVADHINMNATLMHAFKRYLENYYIDLIVKNPALKVFEEGWLRRARA
ncbi:MAG: hypothetical protein LBJ80_00065 [Rickettsiales bacterium]|jgi:lysozyme family protein|nr:hypothetical protein [Rickettsiales bacterium]